MDSRFAKVYSEYLRDREQLVVVSGKGSRRIFKNRLYNIKRFRCYLVFLRACMMVMRRGVAGSERVINYDRLYIISASLVRGN